MRPSPTLASLIPLHLSLWSPTPLLVLDSYLSSWLSSFQLPTVLRAFNRSEGVEGAVTETMGRLREDLRRATAAATCSKGAGSTTTLTHYTILRAARSSSRSSTARSMAGPISSISSTSGSRVAVTCPGDSQSLPNSFSSLWWIVSCYVDCWMSDADSTVRIFWRDGKGRE